MTHRHPDTNILLSLFKEKAELGLTATYEEMSQAITRDIHQCRHRVTSAIAFLQEEYGYVSRCVPLIGYRFLRNNGIAGYESHKFRKKINNHVDRFNDKIATLDYQELSEEELQEALQASIISSSVMLIIGDEFLFKTKEIAGNYSNKSITMTTHDYMSGAKEAIKALWHVS